MKPKSQLRQFVESVNKQKVLPVVTIETPIAVAASDRIESLLKANSLGGSKSRKPKRPFPKKRRKEKIYD